MKIYFRLLLACFVLFSCRAAAQVEKIVVETYYISDADDATDTTGGWLETRSVTYRVYLDLAAGSKLMKIYGDENHALKFSSTEIFFNNKADGQTFGFKFPKNRLKENTVALDSWLTLGQTTTNSAKNFGVLKTSDDDGSFVGGVNSDGGSAGVAAGLLINNDPDAGLPLIAADGNDTMTTVPTNQADYGIADFGDDSTIFGSVIPGRSFSSNHAWLQCSGVSGVNPDSNFVLVAQLTTKGEISFEINAEVKDSTGQTLKYVANDSVLLTGEVYCRSLAYPSGQVQVCGCPDPNYLEYNASRDCDNGDSCKTLIVFGCMDTAACNFNPNANFHLQSLCCYPGYCNDRDVSVVCPSLNYERHGRLWFNLFPNPAHDVLTFQSSYSEAGTHYIIYDCLGKTIAEGSCVDQRGSFERAIDVSALSGGVYIFSVIEGKSSAQVLFIKSEQ